MADPNAYTQAIGVALNDAKSMLGKNEVPNRTEIQSYLRDGGQDLDPHKVAWCAAFVSASLQKAGLPVPTQVVKDSAFGPGAYAPNYLSYGSAVEPKSIQAGDVIVANNGSHVGFAEGPIRQGPNGPEVQLLAGNERDPSGQYSPGSYANPTTGAVANRSQVGMVGERWVPLSQYSARRYQPPADSSQPAAPTASAAPAPPQGTTINTSSVLDRMRENIGQYESGNDYNILGKRTNTGDQAVGKYQVMKSNIPGWTQKWLGRSLTPEQFRADPKAQDAVFNGEFGSYLQNYSPADASSKWFTGQPLAQGANKRDILGTSGARYVQATIKGVDNPYAIGTTINSSPSGAPNPTAGGPAAPAATPAPGTTLPGFQPGSPANKMTQAGLKQLAGGGGGEDEPPKIQPPPMVPAQAVGGAMMIGPGGQNTMGQRMAEQALAQKGFLTQPSLAAFTPGMPQQPMTPPGAATGIPGLPGTTLNSPSQLQMALMTGAMNPYDLYASGGYGGAGGFQGSA